MDWNAGTDWLMRTIGLLLSLADCAERAAGRSNRVRRHVLATLCPAEAAAFRVIFGTATHYGAPIPASVIVTSGNWLAAADGDDPDAALLLADRFRALALALSYIAAWADHFARRLTAIAHTQQCGLPPTSLALAAALNDAAGALSRLASPTRAPP